ncbi:hypothetical protein [Variovorax saccharolyticus]|uniref:hypothetical protein n=1 Tax=Variovorax saccharolyticus TaxID=3053516 RepID=UPI0025773C93|nr:hypothetical protein [Variovorax sp. J22R187]MDM0022663.1 hypothetical protein [Variovorax sp. J22R187]
MSTAQPTPEPAASGAADLAALPASLSPFEIRCLCRRTLECEALLQLAVLGIEQACERHAPDAELRKIAAHLGEAERHAEMARQLACRRGA